MEKKFVCRMRVVMPNENFIVDQLFKKIQERGKMKLLHYENNVVFQAKKKLIFFSVRNKKEK